MVLIYWFRRLRSSWNIESKTEFWLILLQFNMESPVGMENPSGRTIVNGVGATQPVGDRCETLDVSLHVNIVILSDNTLTIPPPARSLIIGSHYRGLRREHSHGSICYSSYRHRRKHSCRSIGRRIYKCSYPYCETSAQENGCRDEDIRETWATSR